MRLKFSLTRFRQLKAMFRPVYFVIILVLSSYMLSELCLMIKQTKQSVVSESFAVRNKTFSEIELTARQLYRLNSSASNLARSLSSSLNGTELTFAVISTRVAPTLFLALSIIPQLSQISYIGLEGLLFSYYNDVDQTIAVYSNTSFSPTWYTKPVNRDTGKLYGDAMATDSMVAVNASWIQKALNSTNGYSSLGTRWNMGQESLFLNTVVMDGRGVISLGFPTQVVVDHFKALDFHGGYFHLGTTEGQVIVQTKLPNTRIEIYNSTIMIQMLGPNDDILRYYNFSCSSDDGNLRSHRAKISGLVYTFYCSTIDIAGVSSVYVLVYPRNILVALVSRNSKLSMVLLVLVFVFVIISLCIYILLTARATNREMFLCAALIKQTEATQQAERKSMNKTKAYSAANHDVRGSLAVITGLIDKCRKDLTLDSELAATLAEMEKCTRDVLDILNSILDMSKMEAGKTSLEKYEFNLPQLLEDVVDMYYPLGMQKKNPVDIVLDPCDGSILRSPLVRGDRVKLKQILCNLLNNANKFTSEGGHVSVRAVVKKNNLEKEIIASNLTCMSKFLSQFCYKKNEDGSNDLDALHRVEENPNEMEFEFEVDDTGKGIPRDKQKSIFEDYVQVHEKGIGQEGCGLGLGIVQSLVRVMKGELRIVEKDPGERGTCFRFNVFLSVCQPESADTEEDQHSDTSNQHFPFMPPKPEGSHLILFTAGEERRRVLKKFIESLNIRVSVIKLERNFRVELQRIKRKLDPLCFSSSGKLESNGQLDQLGKSASTDSDPGTNDGSPSIRDGSDQTTPNYRTNSKASLAFVLLVIDTAAASKSSEFHNTLSNFRKDISKSLYKIVWLVDQKTPHLKDQERLTPGSDYLVSKPLHGSRLIQVLSLLPEFRKCMRQYNFSEVKLDINSSQTSLVQQIVVQKYDKKWREKPLDGKKVLLVDDSPPLLKLTAGFLERLGGEVEVCTNGEEAVNLVCTALSNQRREEGSSKSLPYDYIFMDCEMGLMSGYEATRRIRMEEKSYDVHIPITALTAHAMTEDAGKSIDSGMDFHLTKPLQMDKLLDVLWSLEKNNNNHSQ